MEKSKTRIIQSLLLTLILIVAAFWVSPAAVSAKQVVKDPATGKMIAAPQYGGTITYAMVPRASTDTDTFGTIGHSAGMMAGHALDRIGIGDWAIHREAVGDFTVANFPLDVLRGNLAKSWELLDDTTLIFKIQEGVHFHDKAPVNGREMVADDIAYNYQRMLGIGRFAGKDRAHQNWGTLGLPIESVEASDKSTLVVKLSQPSPNALKQLFDCCHMYIYAPEIIEENGNAEDWRKLVGTGAFQMTDWIEGSSMTYEKNPNYWRHDEKFPQNQLPYVDKIVAVFMGEEATKLAGPAYGSDCIRRSSRRLSNSVYRNDSEFAEDQPRPPNLAVFVSVGNLFCDQHQSSPLRRHPGAPGDANGPGPEDHERSLLSRLW